MKKIMFNDKYGLTEAVLAGRKTMTRRIIPLCENDLNFLKVTDRGEWLFSSRTCTCLDGAFPAYKIGEEVASAQSYESIANADPDNDYGNYYIKQFRYTKEWTNKMFVHADFMPHRIRITNIKVERLQDISEEDCIREGIMKIDCVAPYGFPVGNGKWKNYRTPQDAFACLIDKVSGKGTYERNPWVFAYEFELIK